MTGFAGTLAVARNCSVEQTKNTVTIPAAIKPTATREGKNPGARISTSMKLPETLDATVPS